MMSACDPLQDSAVAAVAAALALDADALSAALTATSSGPRFIRAVSRGDSDSLISLAELSDQLGCTVAECCWLPGVFVAEGTAKLHSCAAFAEGRVAGVDAGSAAAAYLLDPQPGECVLDLCCAPGTKLLVLSELMQRTGWLCGVDVSQERLGAAATVLRKYGAVCPGIAQPGWRLQLFCADGTRFLTSPSAEDATPPTHACQLCPLTAAPVLDSWAENMCQRAVGALQRGLPPPLTGRHLENARQQRQRRFGARPCECIAPDPHAHWCCCGARADFETVARAVPYEGDGFSSGPFHRVLVDAECTHDGSVKHLAKFATQWGWESFERRVLDPGRLDGLQALQRGLLRCVLRGSHSIPH
jgi:hypothetical protein